MTRLKEIFSPGDHGSTFGGNYLSTRAGLTVLEILEEEQSSGGLEERIILFSDYLERLAQSMPERFSEAVGLGLMRGLRAVDAETQGRIIRAAFEAGLIVLKAGRNTVRFLPPLTISREEIEEGFLRFEKALGTLD